MNIEETKREVIGMISELQDEKLVTAVKKMLEEALPQFGVVFRAGSFRRETTYRK